MQKADAEPNINVLCPMKCFDSSVIFQKMYPVLFSMHFRCVVDETVKIYTSHQPNVQFSMDAFKFIGQFDQVKRTKKVILLE